MSPDRDVIESELVPPKIKHVLIELQDSAFGYASGRRHKLRHLLVNKQPLCVFGASQQVPQCECVSWARSI